MEGKLCLSGAVDETSWSRRTESAGIERSKVLTTVRMI